MTRLRGKHSTLRIRSWLPHGALNGSNGWTHNLEAREFANETIQHDHDDTPLASPGGKPERDGNGSRKQFTAI
jgi:hypothetical protein